MLKASSSGAQIAFVARTRKSCYFDCTVRAGLSGVTVYNHMLLPTWYDGESDYWSLVNDASLWDVACQRQVEIKGPDAFFLVRKMTPRNLSKCRVGRCYYLPICDQHGHILNDPMLLRLADDHFWISVADSDILLYAKGLAIGLGLDVTVSEPDVSPLALQGPKSDAVARALLGSDALDSLKFFGCRELTIDGDMSVLVARAGWSGQGGFEFFLRGSQHGKRLWNLLMEAGKPFGIAPGAPNASERIESGLLSFGNDMTSEHNPFEVGLGKYCDVDQDFDFIGKAALRTIRDRGVVRRLVGLFVDSDSRLPSASQWWPVLRDGEPCGLLTSATFSPRLKRHIAFAILSVDSTAPGTAVIVETPSGPRTAMVTKIPFVTKKARKS